MRRISEQLSAFQAFKRILIADGEPLVEATAALLNNGFGFNINADDESKEDIKILGKNNKPIRFMEVKGTDTGVTREHVNQADSHRERVGLPPEFPSILVINTHIKNAPSLPEKDKPVADEQVRHAHLNNVLILRSLDLLRRLQLFLSQRMTREEVLGLLQSRAGWLKVSESGWEILPPRHHKI